MTRTARRSRSALWLALAVLLALLAAGAARAESFPAFTGLVVDQAGVLPPADKAALEQKLEAFQQQTGRQLVVATVNSLEGDDIQQYGYKLGRAWGVGLKGADNGAILLVAPHERKVGIEVGYGLEGVLTDAYSSVVINAKILPAFRAGQMAQGIESGAQALIDLLSLPDDQARAKEQAAITQWDKAHARAHPAAGVPWGLIFWLIVLLFVFGGRFFRRGYGRSYGGWPIFLWGPGFGGWGGVYGGPWERGGGSFGGGSDGSGGGGGWTGGGFTGGGGGSFGGGGASGGW